MIFSEKLEVKIWAHFLPKFLARVTSSEAAESDTVGLYTSTSPWGLGLWVFWGPVSVVLSILAEICPSGCFGGV